MKWGEMLFHWNELQFHWSFIFLLFILFFIVSFLLCIKFRVIFMIKVFIIIITRDYAQSRIPVKREYAIKVIQK